jgi:hypothetical protein
LPPAPEYGILDREFKDGLVFDCRFSFTPEQCCLCFLQRQFDVAVFVFCVDYLCLDDVADVGLFDQVTSSDVFAAVDDTGTKWGEIDVDRSLFDTDHGTFDELIEACAVWTFVYCIS